MWRVAAGTAGEDRLGALVAKKKDKGKDGQARSQSARDAAAQAVAAAAAAGQAQMTRERAQELADELAGAAQRVREALEGVRPSTADEHRDLRARLDALEARVAALESSPASARPRAAGKRGGVPS
jgi:polyhydroxyalkanoate synthesis regulator phasin